MTPSALLFPALMSTLASLHVLPDDTLHRNVQVVVMPDAVEVTFEVGMNDVTLARLGQAIEKDADWDLEPLELARQFTELAARSVGEQLRLSINGQPCTLELASGEPAAKHHQSSRFVYRAQIDAWEDSNKLELVDGNWTELLGQARVALKGKGIRVADSNAALLIVRAEPIELDELTIEERAEMLTIRAVIKP